MCIRDRFFSKRPKPRVRLFFVGNCSSSSTGAHLWAFMWSSSGPGAVVLARLSARLAPNGTTASRCRPP
eukprot:3846096-Alexandrium_andersonii.AAC.1